MDWHSYLYKAYMCLVKGYHIIFIVNTKICSFKFEVQLSREVIEILKDAFSLMQFFVFFFVIDLTFMLWNI